ncbi:hypothetical protein [Anaplasma phagocytophilum]|uniref:hypothetical protein n=1 Tax=Anaplasma phagocytophilum TaxID=948 RepID=UPI0007E25A11|nr:hypothetical protein [Anaplasma phagocytophilum]SBO30405.1 hypothetical protein ANAPC4_00185 [Anaplasma phagocytophilum]SBO30514.1 hypothetical protein ANAPC3_00230 [Anaplasma phagocytophilum]SBO30568.1 hypothetical protein ANAPC2_00304 [Anaplasma phagocytophilum]SCV63855.1 hypothetical protein ANAPC5_00693 [Anaplasma phagocytophilum]
MGWWLPIGRFYETVNRDIQRGEITQKGIATEVCTALEKSIRELHEILMLQNEAKLAEESADEGSIDIERTRTATRLISGVYDKLISARHQEALDDLRKILIEDATQHVDTLLRALHEIAMLRKLFSKNKREGVGFFKACCASSYLGAAIGFIQNHEYCTVGSTVGSEEIDRRSIFETRTRLCLNLDALLDAWIALPERAFSHLMKDKEGFLGIHTTKSYAICSVEELRVFAHMLGPVQVSSLLAKLLLIDAFSTVFMTIRQFEIKINDKNPCSILNKIINQATKNIRGGFIGYYENVRRRDTDISDKKFFTCHLLKTIAAAHALTLRCLNCEPASPCVADISLYVIVLKDLLFRYVGNLKKERIEDVAYSGSFLNLIRIARDSLCRVQTDTLPNQVSDVAVFDSMKKTIDKLEERCVNARKRTYEVKEPGGTVDEMLALLSTEVKDVGDKSKAS